MKKQLFLFVLSVLCGLGQSKGQENESPISNDSDETSTWAIGTYYENERPVVLKFIEKFPSEEEMLRLAFLTVISWKYDGSKNNGMPSTQLNNRMLTLEDAIDLSAASANVFTHVYSRTGNNLKELVYYCTDQPAFMALLNKTLKDHNEYPIEILFYPDKEWSDLKRLKERFKEK